MRPSPIQNGRPGSAPRPSRVKPEAGFTMVEIALCLGIIAIALVAIIGVMPTGLRVQRENRQDTILNQDGRMLVETIRWGMRHPDLLTNYFLSMTYSNAAGEVVVLTNTFGGPLLDNMDNALIDPMIIMVRLSTPKYLVTPDLERVPHPEVRGLRALVRSVSGSADGRSERWRDPATWAMGQPLPDGLVYWLTPELVPLQPRPVPDLSGATGDEFLIRSNQWLVARNLATNFYELRLTLQGPVQDRYVGQGNERRREILSTSAPRTYRTLISGHLTYTNIGGVDIGPFVLPQEFVQVTP